MSNDDPKLKVARAMRDYARSLRSLAADHEMAAAALAEEQRLAKVVEKMERDITQPELALAGAA